MRKAIISMLQYKERTDLAYYKTNIDFKLGYVVSAGVYFQLLN